MANTLRIKRRASGGTGAPSTLASAEIAFNEVDNILYYGKGDAGGTATSIIAIAGPGNYLDITSAQTATGVKTFANGIVGNLTGTASNATLAATATTANSAAQWTTARNLVINGDGSATLSSVNGTANVTAGLTLSTVNTAVGTYGSATVIPVVTVNAKGLVTNVTTQSISTSFSLAADTGTTDTFNTGETLTFTGGEGIDTVVSNNTITIAAELATTSNAGVASFDSGDFAVSTAGVVTVKAGGIDNSQLANTAVTIGSTAIALGGTVTTITGLAAPVNDSDAATKLYVDSAIQGLDPKQSVRAATTTNIATLSTALTIDGVSLVAGDRVLVKDQTTASQNGIYVVSAGSWSRAVDVNTWGELVSAYVLVEEGTTNADNGFICTVNTGGTLDTTAVTFVQFTGAGQITAGAGLTKTGNTLDIGTASTARIVVNADNIDLATIGTAGTYKSVTVDAYGRVSAGTNPTTLAGYGITDAQPLDATLTALAGVTTAANQLIYSTASDTFTTTSLTAFARTILDDADAATVRTTLGLAIGTNVQAYSANLGTIAGLGVTDGNFIVGNGTTWVVESGATARTSLGLGTIATQNADAVAITGGTIDGITIDGGTF